MTFLTNGFIGANLSRTDDAQQHPLGHMATGEGGSVWMYVQASTTVAQYYVVGIDEDFKANPLTAAIATANHSIGVAQVAVDGADYFWALMCGRGGFSVAVDSSCAADVALYTSVGTAGRLDDSATATQCLVTGIRIVNTQASTTGIVGTEAIVTWPQAVS